MASPRYLASWLLWPGLMITALAGTAAGMGTGHDVLWFDGVYVAFALAIGALERAMPHELSWLEDDRQTAANLAHTVLNKGLVQILVVVAGSVGLADAVQPPAGSTDGPWPGQLSMWAQVLLGLVVAEFGLYWAHRLAHEFPLLWRFHAVHHSATRLWFVNTGRFHFVDTFVSIVMSQPLLYLAGAPTEIFLWVSAVTAFVGLLTHCNIEMRFGPISLLFNTPALHRWHHSMDLREGNKNYGENLTVWDLAFGTYFDADRRPPAEIGIDGPMPADFIGQVVAPFTTRGRQDMGQEKASQAGTGRLD